MASSRAPRPAKEAQPAVDIVQTVFGQQPAADRRLVGYNHNQQPRPVELLHGFIALRVDGDLLVARGIGGVGVERSVAIEEDGLLHHGHSASAAR
jgi:hypothetical protein